MRIKNEKMGHVKTWDETSLLKYSIIKRRNAKIYYYGYGVNKL